MSRNDEELEILSNFSTLQNTNECLDHEDQLIFKFLRELFRCLLSFRKISNLYSFTFTKLISDYKYYSLEWRKEKNGPYNLRNICKNELSP